MTAAVKICGLTRREDAVAADAAGARYLGAVFARESPRAVEPTLAARLWSGLAASRVGVFVNASTREVVTSAKAAGLQVIQLHGEEPPEQLAELRGAGGWLLWKAVRVRDAGSFERAVEVYSGGVDGLLLDGWAPGARGGTGVAFAWDQIAPLRGLVPPGVAVIAAGGLRAGNLCRAVELLRPDALDLSSGVESAPGIKDAAAIAAVMETLQEMTR